MTDCPPRLRGDLSKWLCEIHTGVYVGRVSARVREALWGRVCQNLKQGRATMVYTTNGEQGFDFRVHNASWVPVDFDGIKLMRRPLPQAAQPDVSLKPGFSKIAKRQMAQNRRAAQPTEPEGFVVVDLETTGLQPERDSIIELAALRVYGGAVTHSFSRLIRCDRALPRPIVELTGITDALLAEQGAALKPALREFLAFIGKDKLVGYNIPFDLGFLHSACQRTGQPPISNRCVDLLALARRNVYDVADYKLATLAEHFSLPHRHVHRAQNDCELIWLLYRKLNEKHTSPP